jgi:predicted RNase H-like HicB family nuclease
MSGSEERSPRIPLSPPVEKLNREKFMIPIDYDVIVFKEDETFVAYCPELDVSSCGKSVEHAKGMLNAAVRLFLEEAEKMGTLEDILDESKYRKDEFGRWVAPRLVATEHVSVS